jgi:DNA polymerase-1
MTTQTLLVVDGNSLVHRSFHALSGSNLRTSCGTPTWAVKGFISQLLGAIERIGPDGLVVGFDDRAHSVRKQTWPHYKASRKPKPPELGAQIATTIELLTDAGVHVVVPPGLEADDVLASAAATATAAGWHTVIVTSDRDSFALISPTTSVLRVLNGGIEASPVLTPDRLELLNGIRPEQYRDYAAMRGDTSDNLAGIPGIGEKGAAKILTVYGSAAAAFEAVEADPAGAAKAIGAANARKLADPANREAFAQTSQIMTMRTDLDLGLDLTSPGAGLLPLHPDQVRAAMQSLELHSVADAATRLLGTRGAVRQEPAVDLEVPADLAYLNSLPPLEEPPVDDGYGYPPPPAVPAASRPQRQPASAQPVPVLTTSGAMAGSPAPRPTTWDDTLF